MNMASKAGSILDQYRCAPVYDALDAGNNRVAISKADELIRAGNAIQLARALKSVALVRTGAFAEARKICDEIVRGRIDMNVLSPLALVLTHVDRLPQLAELLLSASEASPKDKKLADDALVALVKARMYQRALQELLRRVRTFKEPRDFWRYIQVALLHAKQLKPPGSKLALQIALRVINEQNIDTEHFSDEVLWLYLSFYKEFGAAKLSEALGVIRVPAVQKLVESSLLLQFLRRECWEILGDWEAIAADCTARIRSGDRNWAVITASVAAATRRDTKALDEAVEVLVAAAEQDKWSNRGSFMGVLELYNAAQNAGLPTESITHRTSHTFVELLCSFYRRFCTKASCFEDVFPYFKTLGDADASVVERVAQENITTCANADGIQRRVNAEKILIVRADVSFELAMHKSAELLRAYVESLAHARLPDTEMQLGDDLPLLAIYYLLLGGRADDPGVINMAAGIAAFGCAMSKHAYKLRIVLVRFLLRLGCPQLAYEHFQKLCIKAVIGDTLSHYFLDRNAAFGGSGTHQVEDLWYFTVDPFFRASKVELPEVIGHAFTNGKFSQVTDLTAFDTKVQSSFTLAQVELDMLRAKIASDNLIDAEIPGILEMLMRINRTIENSTIDDHRDMSLLPSLRIKEEESLFRLSQFGPLRDVAWIQTMTEYLTNALQHRTSSSSPPAQSLTASEAGLVQLFNSTGRNEALDTFFNSINKDIESSGYGIALLHASWIMLEGYRIMALCSTQEHDQQKAVTERFIQQAKRLDAAIDSAKAKVAENNYLAEFTSLYTDIGVHNSVRTLYDQTGAGVTSSLTEVQQQLRSLRS